MYVQRNSSIIGIIESEAGRMTTSVPLMRTVVQMNYTLNGHRSLKERQYWPHLVVGNPEQREALIGEGNVLLERYLGVCAWSGPDRILPGQQAEVLFALPYGTPEDNLYSELLPGATFTIREGSKIVGSGRVIGPAGWTEQSRQEG
ncbi:hypothetical protein [Piscinibacter sp.]|uniref:hypothetical protein n=1 Tax=Piscinibacter sp. TaxID=1903157 RepID=UPI0039E3802C